MTGNNQINSSLSAPNKSMQANGNINQMLEQLHADFDPVYSMLMNYQCAVMGTSITRSNRSKRG